MKSAVRTVELLEYLAARHDRPGPHPRDQRRTRHAAQQRARPAAHAGRAQGWVRSDASGTLYGIGIRALLVGTSYLDSDPYLPLITPFLDESARRPRRDVPPGPPRRHRRRLPGHPRVQAVSCASHNRVGRRLPAYATALGKALLADRFGADRDEHVPHVLDAADAAHDHRPRRPRRDALETCVVRGYATDDQENTAGVRCFAVTLRYAVPAQDAISASVPLARLTPERERRSSKPCARWATRCPAWCGRWPTATDGLRCDHQRRCCCSINQCDESVRRASNSIVGWNMMTLTHAPRSSRI